MLSIAKITLTFATICLLVSCAADECEAPANSCDGDMLLECVDGAWADLEDCSINGQMCHEEMGHCMDMAGMETGVMTMTGM